MITHSDSQSKLLVRNNGNKYIIVAGYVIPAKATVELPIAFESFVENNNSLELISKRLSSDAEITLNEYKEIAVAYSNMTKIYKDKFNAIVKFSSPPTNYNSPISVILLTLILNECQIETTTKCINSIVENTSAELDLVIVDNGSIKSWIDILKDYHAHNVILLDKNHGVSGGRNIGAESANNERICFLDDDVIVRKHWNCYMQAAFEAFPDAGVSGFFCGSFHESLEEHSCTWDGNLVYVGGGGTYTTKSIFFDCGMFDSKLFHPFLCEDADFCWRLQDTYKKRIIYVNGDFIYHNPHTTISRLNNKVKSIATNRSRKNFRKLWGWRCDPKTTIIIPYRGYNHQHTIEAINSAKGIPNHEIILSVDGEDVDIPNVEGITVVRHRWQGLSATRNLGIQKATGDFVIFLDPDDILIAYNIQKIIRAMCTRIDIDVCYGHVIEFNDAFSKVHKYKSFSFSEAANNNNVPMGGAIIRRHVFNRYSLFNEAMTGSEDWYFWNMLAAKGAKIVLADVEVVRLRRHSNQATVKHKVATERYGDIIRRLFSFLSNTHIKNIDIDIYTDISKEIRYNRAGPLNTIRILPMHMYDNKTNSCIITSNTPISGIPKDVMADLAVLYSYIKCPIKSTLIKYSSDGGYRYSVGDKKTEEPDDWILVKGSMHDNREPMEGVPYIRR